MKSKKNCNSIFSTINANVIFPISPSLPRPGQGWLVHSDEVLAVKMFAGKVVMMREMREGSHDYDMMLNAFAFPCHGDNECHQFSNFC